MQTGTCYTPFAMKVMMKLAPYVNHSLTKAFAEKVDIPFPGQRTL